MTIEKNVTLEANFKGYLNLNSGRYTFQEQEGRSFAKGTQDVEKMDE